MTKEEAKRIVKCTSPGSKMCGNCERYEECRKEVDLDPWESFPEVGGCKAYINKEEYQMKLINANEFLAERKNALKNNGIYKMLEKWVDAAPGVEVPEGEWIKQGKTTVCSVCGGKAKSLPYCGHCGAKMRVEVDTQ